MVHKKYTYKKGKRFGPYYYETKRVNGEVVTTYLGNHAPKSNLFSKYKFIFLSVLIISLIAFALFYSFGFTGLASLDIKTEYDSGELISGKINLNLVEGELIPADSKIIVNYAGVSKEFVLSSLVSDSVSNGSFYAEGVSLSGEGSGYGISGTKVEYPFVDFEFIIESDSGQQGSSNEGQGNSGSGGSSGEQGNSGSSGGAVNESENPGSSGNSGNENSQGEGQSSSGSSSEEQGNSGSEGSSGSSNGNSGNENGNAGNSNSENGNNGNSGNENTGNENGGNGNSGITGSVVSDSDTISGRASRDEPFIYSLSDGEDAVLVSGSVAYDDDVLDDDVVKFKVGNNELEVSTDYSVETTGFGVDYIGTKKIKISIDLSSFGFVALNDSELSVVLDYNGVEIVSASENIVVSGVSEGNETAEPVEPIVNDTVVGNLTEVNQTLVENVTNITSIINESSIFINLSQFGAVLGQPVKWVKSVAFDVNDSVSLVVEIPLSAENITLDKINLTEYAEIVDLSEEEVDSLRSSMNNRYSELSNGSVSETGLEVNVSSNDSVSEESNSSMLNESVLVRETVSLFNESTSQNLTIGISGGVISGRAISGRVTANVDLKKESFFSRLFKAFFSSITGRVVEEINETEVLNETSKKVKEVSINLSEDDFGVEVEYYTGAPVAVENVLSDRFKTVFVSSPDDVHYENVLMFTNISNLLKVKRYNEIIVEWVENNTQIPVLFVNDTNLDGNYDSVYWVAPRLSNQTFNIIVITSAQHLNENYSFISDIYNETSELDNIWSEPIPSGHYVRVTFEKNLTSENDITIYPRNIQNLSTLVEVYYINSTVKISEFPVINETGYYKIYLTNLTGTSDIFDLRVFNLDNISDAYLEFDYIVDPTAEPNGAKILMAQTCDAMADSESENNYVSVCGGTYPSDCSGDGGTDSISCSDGSLEDTSNTGSTYAGVKITTFNDTITN
ncbi:hypothetical protein J4423_03785, partial [Candidatus Pacearchaeota archaeon]|nr:hypothetical protein [Candidatus Pacearchaeota archaeon]